MDNRLSKLETAVARQQFKYNADILALLYETIKIGGSSQTVLHDADSMASRILEALGPTNLKTHHQDQKSDRTSSEFGFVIHKF